MNIGTLITKERMRQGYTKAEIARRAKLKPDSVASVERGNSTIATMARVTDALGCRLMWTGRLPHIAIGDAIREVRKEQGRPQSAIASSIGITSRTLITLENKSNGSVKVLDAFLKELRIKPRIIPKNRRIVPTNNAPELDVVYTPEELASAVIDHFSPTGSLLEPCRGSGTFLDAFPAETEKHYCEIEEGLDFFDWHQPVDWIISNPPWSQFRAFNIHAMSLAKDIIWIVPLVHFSGKARVRDCRDMRFGFCEILLLETPIHWPQGGYQLAAFHLKHGYTGPTRTSYL